jgi:hypothetical protein
LKLLRIEPSFRPYVAEKKVSQPAVETPMKTEAVMEKPVPKTEEGVESLCPLRDLEEEIRKYSELGFSFTVKMIRGKPWLYAQKRIEGKVKSKSVAVWDEKVSEIALRLGIKIGKGAKREVEKET